MISYYNTLVATPNICYYIPAGRLDNKAIAIISLFLTIIYLSIIVITAITLLIKGDSLVELKNKNFFTRLWQINGYTILSFIVCLILTITLGIPYYKSELKTSRAISKRISDEIKFNTTNNALSSDMESIISTMNGSSKEQIEEFLKSYLEERGYTDVLAHAEFYSTYSSSKYDCRVHLEYVDSDRHLIVRDLSRILPIK